MNNALGYERILAMRRHSFSWAIVALTTLLLSVSSFAVNCTTNVRTATLTFSETPGRLAASDFGPAPKVVGKTWYGAICMCDAEPLATYFSGGSCC